MSKVVLRRRLLGYKWELEGKITRLIDEKNNAEINLDKVRLLSFMKFAVNALDKMRIEEGKAMRESVRKMREQAKAKREADKAKRQQQLFARAHKVK